MTHFSFSIPCPTKRGIKVISILFGFTTVERQTIERKTLKIWVKFGVAAPRPWGKHQNFNPRERCPGHSSNRNCKQKFSSCYTFPNLVPPVFPLTFYQNFVEKFPSPSPSPGVHHVWNLSRPPQALPPKKIWGPPDHPRGRYEGSYVGALRPYRHKKFGGPRTPHGGDMRGQSFNFPPFPLNFPSSDIGNFPRPGTLPWGRFRRFI